MTLPSPTRRPVSTYRLQFNRHFRFDDARGLVPYLDALGVTEVYASPCLMANPGSMHGYDICDHSRLNPELGSEADYDTFCEALASRGMGHILDVVPNHMAADPRSNPWWRDVLENGQSSPFASFFDIDWDPVKPELRGKVLLPILGDQYGRVLERGELQLAMEDGALCLRYGQWDLPINPRQTPRILGRRLDRLEAQLGEEPALREFRSILTALQNLPRYTERDRSLSVERQREKEVARERLARLIAASRQVASHVEQCVAFANGVPGEPASFDLLHELLEQQPYRLASWRTAMDEINYRRFFDVNGLIGLRMEQREVFDAAHGLIARLAADGRITGLRIDHPDGLFDPAAYFDALQTLLTRGRDDQGAPPLYIVAEKILSLNEALRTDWQIHGTTGYGFLNSVAGLFIDRRHTRALRRRYTRLTGQQEPFDEVAYQSRRTILLTAMASELNVLAHALSRLAERDRTLRDFTFNSCRKALREVIACFPVYRTYVSPRGAGVHDRATVEAAVEEARRRNPVMEHSIFELIARALLPRFDDPEGPDPALLHFAMTAQQLTAPVQAKGIEDTACYRYNVLVAANEVGGHPADPGVTVEAFHAANLARLTDCPLEMIATATHDTKRGEDARARLAVLSEMPEEWRRAVTMWMRINAKHRSKIGRAWAPDRNDEYLFYQALLGAWPAEAVDVAVPERAAEELVRRLREYMEKAVREAKVHTSWIDENQPYGRAVVRFVEKVLAGDTTPRFLRSFAPFARRIAAAGAVNSLAQLALKLASPGVSDCYQGTELWDLSLVDPDNRRPVDFKRRCDGLSDLLPLIVRVETGEDCGDEVAALRDSWWDGRIKQFVMAVGLRYRRRHPDLVLAGGYAPLIADGPRAEHIVGFARHDQSASLAVIIPRFTVALGAMEHGAIEANVWQETYVRLPDALRGRAWSDMFTGRSVAVRDGGSIAVGDLFSCCPVALLHADA